MLRLFVFRWIYGSLCLASDETRYLVQLYALCRGSCLEGTARVTEYAAPHITTPPGADGTVERGNVLFAALCLALCGVTVRWWRRPPIPESFIDRLYCRKVKIPLHMLRLPLLPSLWHKKEHQGCDGQVEHSYGQQSVAL
ncbi:hypothetical protein E2C01_017472 [Portunus trituberculatus]|uniref:Secreted protein n=1 Tax=Portunus trituberculatus TaxID=210409 RepID=A0A5B7DRY7_PORTR|nr:hypothetical protein [Portunus trituberculatus]